MSRGDTWQVGDGRTVPVARSACWAVDSSLRQRSFLHTAAAMAAAGVRAWRVPASSPDLNPVEKFWAWLRRRIRIKDCEDLRRRRPPIGKMSLLQSPCARHPRLEGGAARCCSHSCWLSDDLQGGRGQEKGHGQRLAPTHAQCAVSRTGTSVGLSVPKFMLRQEESSSYSCMLLLNTLQTPFPP